MFSYLIGLVSEKNLDSTNPYLALELNGIGYQIWVNLKTLNSLESNKQAKIYTSVAIREDSQKIYGFSDKSSRDLYELLISVSGVGPIAALSILNTFDVDQIIKAVLRDDAKLLSNAPGLGLKTAQKIILDLKNKFGKFTTEVKLTDNSFNCAGDVSSILLNLGFSPADIDRKLSSAKAQDIPDDSELLIKYCLRS